MNPAHLIAAGLLLLTVLAVVVGVLLHQRAELRHRAAMRITDEEAGRISRNCEAMQRDALIQVEKLRERMKDVENELTRISNRGNAR